MAMLEVKNLSISFGGLKAVDDFDITIEKGQLYGLIGPNGAGKTTVFNLLTGVYKPNTGSIVLGGQNLTGKKHHRDQPGGHCQDLPEYPPVRQLKRAGQCKGRPSQPSEVFRPCRNSAPSRLF